MERLVPKVFCAPIHFWNPPPPPWPKLGWPLRDVPRPCGRRLSDHKSADPANRAPPASARESLPRDLRALTAPSPSCRDKRRYPDRLSTLGVSASPLRPAEFLCRPTCSLDNSSRP